MLRAVPRALCSSRATPPGALSFGLASSFPNFPGRAVAVFGASYTRDSLSRQYTTVYAKQHVFVENVLDSSCTVLLFRSNFFMYFRHETADASQSYLNTRRVKEKFTPETVTVCVRPCHLQDVWALGAASFSIVISEMSLMGMLLVLFALATTGQGAEVAEKDENEARFLKDSYLMTLGSVNYGTLFLLGLGGLLGMAILFRLNFESRAAATRYAQPVHAQEPVAYEQSHNVHRNLEEGREKYQ
ncbi:uncharacterized protein LOC122249134 [Penaeus japonicus]|uniref:uncharacterized protein LOC122249134 n=1 Tax=Penaeus japonicus TaxID=27405 RepID=UPI001C70D2E8|nr:uncharacterized protein LOC122249134 [Penaeus japonicus]